MRGGLEERQTEDLPVKVERHVAPQLLRVVGQDLPGGERTFNESWDHWTTGPTIEEILDNKDQNIK